MCFICIRYQKKEPDTLIANSYWPIKLSKELKKTMLTPFTILSDMVVHSEVTWVLTVPLLMFIQPFALLLERARERNLNSITSSTCSLCRWNYGFHAFSLSFRDIFAKCSERDQIKTSLKYGVFPYHLECIQHLRSYKTFIWSNN